MSHFLAMRKSYALASARGECDSVPNLAASPGSWHPWCQRPVIEPRWVPPRPDAE